MQKLVLCVALCATVLFPSCGSKQHTISQSKSGAPFGDVYEMPCGNFRDTKEKFAAVGIYRGYYYQKGECHLNAIANAKAVIREKYHSIYKGMISEYNTTNGNNRGNNIATKLERTGETVIDAILNDAFEVCTKFSAVQDDGMIECYVAIEIFKGEIAKKVARKTAEVLTEEEKMEINFNEFNYRKQIEERIRNFRLEK